MSQQFKIQELDLSLIVFDEELQVRLETDQETVQDYYKAMATEEDMYEEFDQDVGSRLRALSH